MGVFLSCQRELQKVLVETMALAPQLASVLVVLIVRVGLDSQWMYLLVHTLVDCAFHRLLELMQNLTSEPADPAVLAVSP
jgi:hypothetical protein